MADFLKIRLITYKGNNKTVFYITKAFLYMEIFPKVSTQEASKYLRLLIGGSCGILSASIQLYLRPTLRGINIYLDIILGSSPNFLAVLGFSLILINFKKKYQKIESSIMAAFIGIVAHEVFTQSTPSESFGGKFDWNDIIASILGGICAYALEKYFFEIREQKV